MQQYVDRYLAAMRAERGFSDNTTAAYRNDLVQFGEFLRADRAAPLADPRDVPAEVVAGYVAFLHQSGYAVSTVARKIAAVRSFFGYLVRLGVIAANPTDGLNVPKVKKNVPRALQREDVEKLLAAPAGGSFAKALRDRALLELLYATGMRVSEMVTLQVSDVDLEAGEVRLTGRDGKPRALPLSDDAVRALVDYLTRGRDRFLKDPTEAALFINRRGRKLTRQGLWLIIKEQARSAGISDVTPHTLRHSFARRLLNDGADLRDLQERLGHANLSSTQVYTLPDPEPAREGMG